MVGCSNNIDTGAVDKHNAARPTSSSPFTTTSSQHRDYIILCPKTTSTMKIPAHSTIPRALSHIYVQGAPLCYSAWTLHNRVFRPN
ncbi:hypothetical protein PLICRDRAFT_182529 [Plicaturopsis crispa FD-325 SS-3]|nr:hypothetical protein PLICRDRAFT_182529 [Plicaturopsis crispa FD-325 SS-3]